MIDPQPTLVLPTVLPVRRNLGLAFALSAVLAELVFLAALAGLIYGASGLYRSDPQTLPAFIGQDAMMLFLGLPLLVGSSWLAKRESLSGLLVWLGTLFSIAYSYAFYVLSPEFNGLYPVYLLIVSTSAFAGLYVLLAIDPEAVRARFSDRAPVRPVGAFLMAVALFMSGTWVLQIASHLAAGNPPGRVEQVVWPMDLTLAFPAMFWAGLWVWRRQPLGYVVAGALLLKAAFVGLTLVVTSGLVAAWGARLDPMLPAYVAVGGGGLLLLARYVHAIVPFRPAPAMATYQPRSNLPGVRAA